MPRLAQRSRPAAPVLNPAHPTAAAALASLDTRPSHLTFSCLPPCTCTITYKLPKPLTPNSSRCRSPHPLPVQVDRKVLQLEMERLSLVKAADTDRGARQRLSGLDNQLAGGWGRRAVPVLSSGCAAGPWWIALGCTLEVVGGGNWTW